jgi:molybdopterin-guanine dinucleotide biosynthesis protein A
MKVLGALIAGGASTRYGAAKALAEVGGMRVIDRARGALLAAVPQCVAIVNDPALAATLDVPSRPDAVRDGGPLAGVLTALRWAAERGDGAILAAGCDMPFLSAELLHELVARLAAGAGDAVLPESGGRRGIEPLCAAYSATCAGAIERALGRGDRRMIGFHPEIRVARIALAEVRRFGDPEHLFFNINTPEDRAYAESIATAT